MTDIKEQRAAWFFGFMCGGAVANGWLRGWEFHWALLSVFSLYGLVNVSALNRRLSHRRSGLSPTPEYRGEPQVPRDGSAL